jgi:hypothetical protein
MQLNTKAILVWSFYDAPKTLQELSDHGGDETWLALIPPEKKNDWIGWMDEGSAFGCASITEHEHPDFPGYLIKIGSH